VSVPLSELPERRALDERGLRKEIAEIFHAEHAEHAGSAEVRPADISLKPLNIFVCLFSNRPHHSSAVHESAGHDVAVRGDADHKIAAHAAR
jgi:hypothetical protein